jgi:hypothetical protein
MDDFFTKSFVIPFYKAFLGFFVLVLLISGVFMEYKQHVLVAERVLENDLAFLAVVGLFLIFGIFQIRFQINLMNETRYRVFHSLAFLPTPRLLRIFLGTWVKTHTLLLIYSFFLTYVAISSGGLIKPILLWLILLGIFSLDFAIIYSKIQRPFPDRVISKALLFPRIPFSFWFLKQLESKRPMLILLVKLVSLLLLNGFIFSYQSGGYDLRWIAFGLLSAAFLHYPIWLEKVRFESEELTWFLNLPRSILLKIGQQLVSFGILLLPEFILIVLNFPGFHSLQLILLLLGVNLGLYGLVIFQYQDIDWTKVIISSFFLAFILIIFSVPLWLLFILSLSAFVIGIKSPYRV